MRHQSLPTLLTFTLSLIATILSGCGHKTETRVIMDIAERQMQTAPDSALSELTSINRTHLGNDKEKARFALLMSMALDKNYIDTTTFDIIQPAIDYYNKRNKGDANEKLRTLYYQGRIYSNRGEDDMAMKCYLKANGLEQSATDTLLVAHMYVATAVLNNKQYKLADFISDNLKAAKLYIAIKKNKFAAKSLTNALYGEMKLDNKTAADSLMKICTDLAQNCPETRTYIQSARISYIVEYGGNEDITALISELKDSVLNEEDAIDLARGYSKLGRHEDALQLLSAIDLSESPVDSLKYLATKLMILENTDHYKETLKTYREYDGLNQQAQFKLLTNDLLFAEERHKLEIDTLRKLRHRDRIIGVSVIGCLILLLLALWLHNKYRVHKATIKTTEEEKQRLMIEKNNASLRVENLENEKKRIEAEKNKSEKYSADLRKEIDQLKEERDRLTSALKKLQGVRNPVHDTILSRIGMLNGLLAKEISGKDKYAKDYRQYIELLHNDKPKFMNSIREAFAASYPITMKHMEECGLTTEEVNILCLYTIGLQGKDVGDYTQLKRHYIVSSNIRKKLGLDEHQTNLGLYIRQLMKEESK